MIPAPDAASRAASVRGDSRPSGPGSAPWRAAATRRGAGGGGTPAWSAGPAPGANALRSVPVRYGPSPHVGNAIVGKSVQTDRASRASGVACTAHGAREAARRRDHNATAAAARAARDRGDDRELGARDDE